MSLAQFSAQSVQAQKKSPIVLEKIHPRSLNEANIRFVSGMNAKPVMSAAAHHIMISFPIIQMISHPDVLCNGTVYLFLVSDGGILTDSSQTWKTAGSPELQLEAE